MLLADDYLLSLNGEGLLMIDAGLMLGCAGVIGMLLAKVWANVATRNTARAANGD